MKTALKVQLGQQLNLTPQLLQSIRLLQLDALQLEQEIGRALETNPLLEREEGGEGETPEAAAEAAGEVELRDAPEGLEWLQAARGSGAGSLDDDAVQRLPAGESSDMRQRLLAQFELECHAGRELALAALILDHVDDSGYLEIPFDELAARARAEHQTDTGELERVRQKLMRCEPVGVGARDLRECLLVQLDELPGVVPGRVLARRLVQEHLDLLALHDPVKLGKALDVEPEQAAEAERLVLSLNPRPGAAMLEAAAVVIPDVLVTRGERGWQVALNPATAPRIRVNPLYEQLLGEGAADDAASRRFRDLLNEARWLTRGLGMRYDTLLRATRAIVERQQAFLEQGDEAMVPLNLKDIADAIGMHESTISRITTGKYVQTPRGTYELKHFFGVRLEGASVAGAAVKAMVKKLIDGENPEAPLADDDIAVLLARQGVRIARRTVAKYRDQLRIPSAKERKRSAPGGPVRYAAPN
ncbi:RNA polymerase factor sigma-54 [Rehaibacterium terrae]|jgi:RNA polymerase sigma-54 factor|uniref:RNA polymerase sigma-54 factor n=1 Tax=Rehaibacterium terrae TaxID=1341696 RepID=A0A7W7Y1S2_9GAMM|nr:RNA polymerase factor sigma-54 [Rehaibacterium terrae]MBB5016490.1 RNA polymerase sigma-54 factor [Rehaibacterium terrae]